MADIDLVQRLRNHTGSGLSAEAADAIERLVLQQKWEFWFAWHPVRTADGRVCWLRYMQRAWDWSLRPWAHDGYSGNDGGWVYRLPMSPNVRAKRGQTAQEGNDEHHN